MFGSLMLGLNILAVSFKTLNGFKNSKTKKSVEFIQNRKM
ncbi:hypothetical protein LEP1GSC021_1707 [Leptospira noguchii str. 1993005606]|uniref:Uncharacterized protein n=3 Tax=Leptospira noguchii TaxID=28182 RepID=M6YAA1_9LEPT|nr:hypothetical protein LEP1GSC072_3839 [Leptospira noguchii str. Bonito]EMM99792.1 hypothetical protein LEP1GSC035_0736 [Leptospira noguchii str. 2007001578]EMO41811.1 hypothetical protein LEP1GSC186_2002 [Leptospira noguchii serovar Autumnalis str. ZUN142]EMO91267.1 hypothetical protein LEP1GSC024_3056 [Leptospira noguchii str. 2001034031]EMS83637.1 hypothetical protein LEP1GSC073_2339 [Leptospira noguchii str. Cascata]EMS87507.1 hypothetical protein LEP1GSC074_3145 [Leptospira noguchii str.